MNHKLNQRNNQQRANMPRVKGRRAKKRLGIGINLVESAPFFWGKACKKKVKRKKAKWQGKGKVFFSWAKESLSVLYSKRLTWCSTRIQVQMHLSRAYQIPGQVPLTPRSLLPAKLFIRSNSLQIASHVGWTFNNKAGRQSKEEKSQQFIWLRVGLVS